MVKLQQTLAIFTFTLSFSFTLNFPLAGDGENINKHQQTDRWWVLMMVVVVVTGPWLRSGREAIKEIFVLDSEFHRQEMVLSKSPAA